MAEMIGRDAARLLAGAIAVRCTKDTPPLIGLNGAQGSGKSTMAAQAEEMLAEQGLRLAVLSLDDFYLTRTERQDLARRVHPLCATRGVPGTHDVTLIRQTIGALANAGAKEVTHLPAFDKLVDDRLPREQWGRFRGRPDAMLLEGWCAGLRSEDLPPWTGAINSLECECDPNGIWAAWSREALKRDYDDLWQSFALLASIEVPDLDTVISSRLRQERELAEKTDLMGMDREAVTRFVQHYERYTRALWNAMPHRADLLLRRDASYRYTIVKGEVNE